ncbi:hypothetical protein LIT25_23255 [Bacillus sp. F19]|nr:hypothetical protein LIT25_23255 [Bacillus sp. F19]
MLHRLIPSVKKDPSKKSNPDFFGGSFSAMPALAKALVLFLLTAKLAVFSGINKVDNRADTNPDEERDPRNSR